MNWHREQKRLARIEERQRANFVPPPPKAKKPSNRYERMMAKRGK